MHVAPPRANEPQPLPAGRAHSALPRRRCARRGPAEHVRPRHGRPAEHCGSAGGSAASSGALSPSSPSSPYQQPINENGVHAHSAATTSRPSSPATTSFLRQVGQVIRFNVYSLLLAIGRNQPASAAMSFCLFCLFLAFLFFGFFLFLS